MSPSTITLLFLAFAIVSFILEKIPLGLTATIVAIGLNLTGVLSNSDTFAGYVNSNVILCVGMRMLMGLCCGYVYKLCRRADAKGTWSYFVGAVSAPLLNTLFFMGYIVLVFYRCDYVQGLVSKLGATNPLMFVVLLVGIQGLAEAGACGVLGGILGKTLDSVLKRQK